LRVRWLPQPDTETFAFVPVFSESLCHNDAESLDAGLEPACVRACPTDTLVFGDFGDVESSLVQGATRLKARRIEPDEAPEANDLKRDVVYRDLPKWVGGKLNLGAALDPRDDDPIYEQTRGQS